MFVYIYAAGHVFAAVRRSGRGACTCVCMYMYMYMYMYIYIHIHIYIYIYYIYIYRCVYTHTHTHTHAHTHTHIYRVNPINLGLTREYNPMYSRSRHRHTIPPGPAAEEARGGQEAGSGVAGLYIRSIYRYIGAHYIYMCICTASAPPRRKSEVGERLAAKSCDARAHSTPQKRCRPSTSYTLRCASEIW